MLKFVQFACLAFGLSIGSVAAQAVTPSPAMIEQFKQLPQAEQERLFAADLAKVAARLAELADQRQALFAGGGFADDLHLATFLEDEPVAGAHERVVVKDENSDHMRSLPRVPP